MKPDGYQPIDCARYSEYELAIMHHDRLRLTWRDAAGDVHIGILEPVDLRTRRGEEFMVAADTAGDTQEIRLDRILHCEPA